MKGFLFCFFTVFFCGASAQGLDAWLHKYEVQPALSLDNRYTRLMGNDVTIWGGRLGVDFEEKYHTGFGYYFLNTNITMPYYGHTRDISGNLNLYYFTYYFDLTLYQSKKWELRLPIDIGYGHKFFNYTGQDDKPHSESGQLFLVEPSLSVTYRVWKWVGLGASAGGRKVLMPLAFNTRDLSGPFASVKVKIYLYDFYDDMLSRFLAKRVVVM